MQLNELLAQIDQLKVEIDALRPLKPEVEHRIMQKFRLDWNYHSNAIEGNSLTLGETRAFLLEGLTANGKPLKDHLDIRGHDDLISFLQLFIQRKERLTEAAIREMHKILLKEPYETDAVTSDGRIVKRKVQLGVYKSEPNGVRMASGEFHQYTLPADVPAKMAELVEWHRKQEETKELHPAVFAALFHHRFVSIHPFDDGNGRMGRILMNLVLMRSGFPPVVIKLQDREPYVAALRRADAGESGGIVTFIGNSLIDASNLYLKGAHGESIEDADDIDKAVSLLKQELRNAPTPISLTQPIQHQHIEKDLIPLLRRLDQKMTQFDDLFSRFQWQLNTSIDGGQSRAISGKRPEFIAAVAALTGHQALIREITFFFSWIGFLRDGTNDFSCSQSIRLQYEERKFHFYRDANDRNRMQTMLYGQWFTEDETKKLLNEYAKHMLDSIERERSRSRI